jgi:hypothetical protein
VRDEMVAVHTPKKAKNSFLVENMSLERNILKHMRRICKSYDIVLDLEV